MRKMKQLLKTLLALALVLALLPVYNVSAGRSNMQLDADLKAQIQEDYLAVHKAANLDSADIQKMTAEDILVLDYYGKYSGYEIVQIFFKNVQMTFDEVSLRIGRYEFLFNGSTAPYFFAYKDSEFIPVKDAYEQGLLSQNDLSYISVEFGAEIKWLEPGAELEREMCDAFEEYLKEIKHNYRPDLGALKVVEYYGSYNGYRIAQMGFENWVVTTDVGQVDIAGYTFTFASSAYPKYFLAYKDGEMLLVKDAYAQGLVSKEDIINLAVFRGDAIPPDKCVKHKPVVSSEEHATAISQGYIGNVICEKCFTVLEAARWVPTAAHTRFKDVWSGEWYIECIDYCDKNGIMVGINDTHFKPNVWITRGEFITTLHRLEGAPKASEVCEFIDVATDSFYSEAVAWGVEKGIVYGTTASTYSPDLRITREDIACLVARYAKAIEADFLYDDEVYPLPDVSVPDLSDYARESYQIVYSEGIMVGNANGMFYPKAPATRAEVASVLMNLHKKLNGPEVPYLQVGDGEDAWIYQLPEQDANRLRELLDLDSEVWKEELRCECIGACQIVLDGIRYIVDWDDLTHQVKYEALYGGVSGAVVTEDTDTLNQLGAMLSNYKFIYELTK